MENKFFFFFEIVFKDRSICTMYLKRSIWCNLFDDGVNGELESEVFQDLL